MSELVLLTPAASNAASLTRFQSAPENPASQRQSPPSSRRSRGDARVWTLRIASRPALSGRLTTTRRSKRPGRRSALSSTSGWISRRQHDDALAARETVHFG